MKLRFTPQALSNLNEIADYLSERSPNGASNVRTAILNCLEILKSFPNAGRLQTTEGVRKAIAQKYPYLIYYSVDDANSAIIVLSIKHPARESDHENE